MRPRNSGAVLRQTRDPPLTTPTDTRIAYLVTPLQKVARDAARFVPTAAPKARRQHACACCSHAHGVAHAAAATPPLAGIAHVSAPRRGMWAVIAVRYGGERWWGCRVRRVVRLPAPPGLSFRVCQLLGCICGQGGPRSPWGACGVTDGADDAARGLKGCAEV